MQTYVPTLYNPTPFRIEGGFNGNAIYMDPGEVKPLYDAEVVSHMVRSRGYLGLTDLYFGPKTAEKYNDNYELFKADKEIGAFEKLLKHCEEVWVNERQAIRNMREKGGSEFDKIGMNSKKFEERYELVKAELDKARARREAILNPKPKVAAKPTATQAAKAKAKKVKDEQTTTQGEGSA